ncbi:MAG: protein-L-isoaspartate O-methyltransferase [Rhodospirillales bacterium]|nr:protein-L-isoaspartate O-methyltransferase [Rhodospirillales bacterium]
MDFAAARRKMVENQIRTNRVTDPLVIAALSDLPRELFVPERLRGIAYVDEDIPLGDGRVLMEPLVTALILQAAEITATDVVLDVGCGTGYIAAAAAQMASAVIALESIERLAASARDTLEALDVATVSVVDGPLTAGYAEHAPYDVILFGGAVSKVPAAIMEQLAEGGRLVAVVADEIGLGKGTVFLRTGGIISQRAAFDSAVPLLSEFVPSPTFQF